MYRATIVLTLAAALAACGEPVDPDVVAQANDHRLRIGELAEWLSTGKSVPLRRDIVERFAHRWVEYSLYAQRLAAGDSLVDSVTVLRVMWPDLEQAKLDVFHERLVEQRVRLDSAAVDSAYQAGVRRFISHILIRTQPDMAPPAKSRARREAEQVRARLLAGEEWSELNERYNEDPGVKGTGGALGVVTRQDLVPDFAEAAFALAPGAISDVTETSFGYHLIRRPPLAEVRDAFRDAIETHVVQGMDSTYYAELEEKWRIAVRADAPGRVREAAEAPMQFVDSDDVLGTYRGGRFTVADLIKWLQVLAPQAQQQVLNAGDEQLKEFLRSLIRNEVLIRVAREEKIAVPPAAYAEARTNYLADMRQLRATLGLDSALAVAASASERRRRAQEAVDRYMARMIRTLRDVVIVPPFLAYELREEARWRVSAAAIDRVVSEATALRARAGRPPTPVPEADTTRQASEARE